jgi:hypothetical protein
VPVFENNTEEQKSRFMMVLKDEYVVEWGRTFIPFTVQSREHQDVGNSNAASCVLCRCEA